MADIVTVEGPLDRRRLGWIAELYGRTDLKYAELELLDHLFAKGPAGPALHAFALDDGRPVGHCAVVPLRARRGGEKFVCGKVEALFVDEAHRGRREAGRPLVLELVARLYRFADEHGIELLHAYVRPAVGRVLGLEPVRVGERSLVAVARPRTLTSPRLRWPGTALAVVQRGLRESAYLLARLAARGPAEPTLRAPRTADADLAAAPPPPPRHWTVLAEDAWDWYCTSPLLRVLEIPGPFGCRALVQLPGAPGDPVRLVGWQPERGGLVAAVLLVGAAARVARRAGAGTLRFQPWPAPPGDGALRRACRLLGFVARSDFTTLYVRPRRQELAHGDAVVPTPLLYLAF